jgi:hypothetical protein
MEKMNIGPKARYLYSVRAERGDIVRLCSEAVDNALDAMARNVHIEIADGEIKFTDDGLGVLQKDFPALFTLGDHVQHKTTKLGRFGVGITNQAINAADLMEVRSISADGSFICKVNWRDVLTQGWEVDAAFRLPMVVGTPTGTTIKLSAVRKLKPFTIGKVIDDLAEGFYPAIAEGRKITVNGVAVPLLADPPMTEIVVQTFSFTDGRSAMLRAGLLIEPAKINRVHVGFEHRVIKPSSTLGCGNYTGLSNMFARVQLIGARWALSTFKNDITNEDQLDELEDAVEAAMTPILEKCGNVSMEARVAAIGELVNSMLPEEMAAARPHHKKKGVPNPTGNTKTGKTGTVDVANSDPAAGPAKAHRAPQKDRLLITFEGRDKEHGIGWFEAGRTNRVHLSRDNPSIAHLFQHRDDRFIAIALHIVALMMFEHGREAANPQLQFRFLSYGLRVARHLSLDDAALPKQAG